MPFLGLKRSPFISSLPVVCTINGCRIVSNFVVTSTKPTVWFFFFNLNMVNYIDFFQMLNQPCISGKNKTHFILMWCLLLCFAEFCLLMLFWGFLNLCSGRILVWSFPLLIFCLVLIWGACWPQNIYWEDLPPLLTSEHMIELALLMS